MVVRAGKSGTDPRPLRYGIVGTFQGVPVECGANFAETMNPYIVCMIDGECDPDCEEPHTFVYWIYVTVLVLVCISFCLSICHCCNAISFIAEYNNDFHGLVQRQITATDDWMGDRNCKSDRAKLMLRYPYYWTGVRVKVDPEELDELELDDSDSIDPIDLLFIR